MDTKPLVEPTTSRTQRRRKLSNPGTSKGNNDRSIHSNQPNSSPDLSNNNNVTDDVTNNDVRDKCCYQGRYFWDALKAIIARQLFFFHALVAIWRLAAVSGNGNFWYMTLTFILMFVEALVILFWRRGQEWKWFQPGVLCYLASVVPPIWLLELDHLGFIDLLRHTPNQTSVDQFELFPWIRLDKRQWLLALEQSLLVLIILNRWIIPKGALSRDGLSQLLLTHLGTACDIVDFYSILSETTNRKRTGFCYVVLTIWTVSIHQFCIISTAKRDVAEDDGDAESDYDPENDDNEEKPQNNTNQRDSQLHRKMKIDDCAIAVPVATGNDIQNKRKEQWQRSGHRGRIERVKEIIILLLETDAWSTILSLLMQDLPFFVIRATTILGFHVMTYTNCFFAAKNMLVLILQCYRVYSVSLEHYTRGQESRKARQNMWLVKVKFLDYPDPQRWKRDRAAYNNMYFKF